ncbi:MAG: hypothetical protein JW924_08345 [Fusobacteriaceae bacterium]|nr:hypothetical protein [Fusobacteriaceae bacterium]
MRGVLVFIFIAVTIFSNTLEVKKIELEILKSERDRYVRQQEIKYSELEKLQMDEKIVEKDLDISKFLQQQLEQKMKYEARLTVLNELIPVLELKDSELSKKYSQLKTSDGISKIDLAQMDSSIKTNKNDIVKNKIERNFINEVLKSEEFTYINKSLKEDKIINLTVKAYDSIIQIREQEVQLVKIEEQGKNILKSKEEELKLSKLQKQLIIENDRLNMTNLKSNYEMLIIEKENVSTHLKFLENDLNIFEQKVNLGAGSQKELFDKTMEKYKYMEEKIRIEGEIKLKEIELDQ